MFPRKHNKPFRLFIDKVMPAFMNDISLIVQNDAPDFFRAYRSVSIF